MFSSASGTRTDNTLVHSQPTEPARPRHVIVKYLWFIVHLLFVVLILYRVLHHIFEFMLFFLIEKSQQNIYNQHLY